MNKVQELQNMVDGIKTDYEKFEKGNKTAGTRVRKGCQSAKKLLQELRLEITERKKQ